MKQREYEWYLTRLGKINGSEVGDLMTAAKTKAAAWSATAESYLMKVASEQILFRQTRGDITLLTEYFGSIEIGSKSVQWGVDNEPLAKNAYTLETGKELREVGSLGLDGTILRASPDALTATGALEIKCPYTIKTSVEYALTLGQAKDNEETLNALKGLNKYYFWQVVAESVCANVDTVDFCVFDPRIDLLFVRSMAPTEEDKNALIQKAKEGEAYIKELVNRYYSK